MIAIEALGKAIEALKKEKNSREKQFFVYIGEKHRILSTIDIGIELLSSLKAQLQLEEDDRQKNK